MTNRKMAHFLLASFLKMSLLLFFLFVFVSCAKATSGTIPLGEQELPDMLLEDAQYTLGRPNEDALIMKASKIEIYKSEKGTTLEEVHFWQDTEDGFTGSCKMVQIDEDNNHATLTGEVAISRESDHLQIYANSIEWDNEEMTLQTTGTVRVIYGEGTEIEAQGFYAKLDEDVFEFENITRGTINE